MKPKDLFNTLKLAFQEFGEDRATTLGAALAYYTVFAIGPLLVVVIGLAGIIFGEAAASGQVMDTVKGFLGEDGAKFIQSIIQAANAPRAGIIASIVGLLGLLFGAMAIFRQLKNALNLIWNVSKKDTGGILNTVFSNVLSFVMVLLSVLILLLTLVVNAIIASIGTFVRDSVPGGSLVLQIVNYLVTFLIITLTFALIFKMLPDLKIDWKDVWLGALITSLLFVIGQVVLGIYFSVAHVGSAFGAAGSLVIVLVWVYYSAQIIFFGAEITQVYANNYGSQPTLQPFRRPDLSRLRRLVRRRSDTAVTPGAEPDKRETARSSPWFSSED